MCCSNMQRHAWTIVSTPIYKCFSTGHNKLASAFKYFKIVFYMSLLHVIMHLIIKQFLWWILIIIFQLYLQCSDIWLGMWGLNWPHTSSPKEESPYFCITNPEFVGKDNRHPASNNPGFFQLFCLEQMPTLLSLPHHHFNLHYFGFALGWSRCSCLESSHLAH